MIGVVSEAVSKGNLVAAGERIEERIDVVAVLTARRDSIQNQPGRRAEAEAIEVAIAKRLDDKLEGLGEK